VAEGRAYAGGGEPRRAAPGELLLPFYGDYWVIGLAPDTLGSWWGDPRQ
jgi:lipocalin